MPKSHHSHPSHSNIHKPPVAHKNKKPASAIFKITLILLLLGLAIGALGSGFNTTWMAAGSLVGAIGGFLIGLAVDRTLAKKKYE
jgi:membrane associated rhomboid family serine protease